MAKSHTEKVIEWINEIVKEKTSSPQFYGTVSVSFQAGKVSVVEVKETFKPPPDPEVRHP